ncbi:MAG: glycerate kinase [Succinivibrio sp.]|nr:glycerate kinase [Succinivibrio sp.]
MFKVVLALDSFKGCMSSMQACKAAAAGVLEAVPDAVTVIHPVSDGGEGMLEVLASTPAMQGSVRVPATVLNAYSQPHESELLIKGDLCVIESALCCGIEEAMRAGSLHIEESTTFGVGQMVKSGLKAGCRRFVIGLGGSATNDGGAGFLQALGVRFYRRDGNLISDVITTADLDTLGRVDFQALPQELRECTFEATCDVDNTLLGPKGATWVFGAQKGGTTQQLERIEQGMANYAALMDEASGRKASELKGGGAAGGLGAAIGYLGRASFKRGIESMLDLSGFDAQLEQASLIITGEGRTDAQSAHGKVPHGVAAHGRRYRVPVVCVSGALADGAQELYKAGIGALFSLCDGPLTLSESMRRGEELLRAACENVMRLYAAACGTCLKGQA